MKWKKENSCDVASAWIFLKILIRIGRNKNHDLGWIYCTVGWLLIFVLKIVKFKDVKLPFSFKKKTCPSCSNNSPNITSKQNLNTIWKTITHIRPNSVVHNQFQQQKKKKTNLSPPNKKNHNKSIFLSPWSKWPPVQNFLSHNRKERCYKKRNNSK